MLTTNVQELEGWRSDRNCDLRNVLEFGDPSLMTKINAMLEGLLKTDRGEEILPFARCFHGGQGTNQLVAIGSDVATAGQSKSSVMSSLIDAAAKRHCIAVGSEGGVQQ